MKTKVATLQSEARVWDSVPTIKPEPWIRKQTMKWTTAKGERIRICDMTDWHLINAVKLMDRAAQLGFNDLMLNMYQGASMMTGEMATYYADQAINQAEREGWEGTLPPIYHKMMEDIQRCGIQMMLICPNKNDPKKQSSRK